MDPPVPDEPLRLHAAALCGSVEVVKELVRRGHDVHAVDKQGHTALHMAAKVGSLELVKYLIDLKSDVNAKGNEGTPLQVATTAGSLDIVKALVQNGADVNLPDTNHYTAFHKACLVGDLNVVKFLKDSDADINSQTNDGRTALHLVAETGQMEIVRFLIECGVTLCKPAKDGRTAINRAAIGGQLEVLKYLFANGGRAHQRDWLRVAFDIASSYPGDGGLSTARISRDTRTKIMAFVFENFDLDINSRDFDGSTIVHGAAKSGQWDMVRDLIRRRANPFVRNRAGKTAWDVAEPNFPADIMDDFVCEHYGDNLMYRIRCEHPFDPVSGNAITLCTVKEFFGNGMFARGIGDTLMEDELFWLHFSKNNVR